MVDDLNRTPCQSNMPIDLHHARPLMIQAYALCTFSLPYELLAQMSNMRVSGLSRALKAAQTTHREGVLGLDRSWVGV